MSDKAVVTIGTNQWLVDIANQPWELSQGLSGVSSMVPGSGMLFDTGYDHIISVTTQRMLFNLDVIFISSSLIVTEIYRDVSPGYVITSELPARYFLEVNAGEADDVTAGEEVSIGIVTSPSSLNLDISSLMPFINNIVMLIFAGILSAEAITSFINDTSNRLYGSVKFLPDSYEFLAYTIEDIGYRDKIDNAFTNAIRRSRG